MIDTGVMFQFLYDVRMVTVGLGFYVAIAGITVDRCMRSD